MHEEEWRQVISHENYLVSSFGRVFSIKRNKILSQFNTLGYMHVALYDGHGNQQTKKVHRLVAEAFLDSAENDDVVNHIDGDKAYNFVENLEWCSQSHNAKHAYATGLKTVTNKKAVRILETGEVFESLSACAESIGGSVSTVSNCLSGKNKSHRGYTFGPA